MNRDETMTTDPTTGGQKADKLARFDLIPAGPLVKLAEHFGIGARKYDDRNWEKGYAWSKSFAAMMRHAWLWWSGEDIDPESGDNHLVSVAWHAFALLEWAETRPELDDRPEPTITIPILKRKPPVERVEVTSALDPEPRCVNGGPLPSYVPRPCSVSKGGECLMGCSPSEHCRARFLPGSVPHPDDRT